MLALHSQNPDATEQEDDEISNADTDIIAIYLNSITIDDVIQICTEFANNSDTIIGMENDWTEYLVKNDIYVNMNQEDIKERLMTNDDVMSVNVRLFNYNTDIDIYIAIEDYALTIATKKRLLYV
jgi:hypothetical protein